MVTSCDSDFECFTFDDVQNIKDKYCDLFLGVSAIDDICKYSLDEEDFENESIENIENLMAAGSKVTSVTTIHFTENTGPQHNPSPDPQPIDHLFLILPESSFEAIAEQTNE